MSDTAVRFSRPPQRAPVCLLDLDPDLGEWLDRSRLPLAHRQLMVRLAHVVVGQWRPEPDAFGAEGGVGLLLVEGFAIRRVQLAHRTAAELLGPGDLLRPWQDDGEHAHYPFSAGFRLLGDLTVAVLDANFLARCGAFPEVLGALFGRAMERSRSLAGNLAVAQLPSVEDRVLVELWHLADRFGRVRRDGVILPLRLSHEVLGALIGARRPSVTTALGRLAERELVIAQHPGWLLVGDPPAALGPVRAAGRLRGDVDEVQF
jgi:CRP-like cAMP-binding protein